MDQANLDALLTIGPENVSYVTNAPIGPVHQWRNFGPYVALIPADSALSTAAVVTDTHRRATEEGGVIDEIRTHPAWIEYVDVTDRSGGLISARVADAMIGRPSERPERFELSLIMPQLRELLADRGLDRGRIGVEFDHLPLADQQSVAEVIGDAEMVDSSALYHELRLIKSEREIQSLRIAVDLTCRAIHYATSHAQIGAAVGSVSMNFKRGIIDAAEELEVGNLSGSWDIISVGERPWSASTRDRIVAGDVIKFDCGAIVGGYMADFGRTYVVGQPTDAARTVHAALRAGIDAALETLQVGVPFSAIFAAMESAIRGAGFPKYTRGHFGHSIGANIGQEEWPWISKTEGRRVEHNMVLAIEAPFYLDGVGGFMIEHNVLVRDDGIDVLDTLPTDFGSIG